MSTTQKTQMQLSEISRAAESSVWCHAHNTVSTGVREAASRDVDRLHLGVFVGLLVSCNIRAPIRVQSRQACCLC